MENRSSVLQLMFQKVLIDGLLDSFEWGREVSVEDLDGAEHTHLRNTSPALAIKEPATTRDMSYRAFNLLTLAAHDYVRVLRHFSEEMDHVAKPESMDTLTKDDWRKTDVEEAMDFSPILRREGMDMIAEHWREIEEPRFQTAVRYYVRPHARLVRRNYDHFPGTQIGPLNPGGELTYRGSGNPTRVVYSNDRDPLSW